MKPDEVIKIADSYPLDEVVNRYAESEDIPVSAAAEHAEEVKRYLVLCALNPHKSYAMRGPIDEFWHTFISFTWTYTDFCNRIAGKYLHHFPNIQPRTRIRYSVNKGRRGEVEKKKEPGGLREAYLAMLRDYETTFKSPAPSHIWPRPATGEEPDNAPCMCGCNCRCSCNCRCIA